LAGSDFHLLLPYKRTPKDMVIGLTTYATRASALTEDLGNNDSVSSCCAKIAKRRSNSTEKGANQAIISLLRNARIPTVHGVEFHFFEPETLLLDEPGPVIWIGGLITAPAAADENGGGSGCCYRGGTTK
jgi:hypothetical protein